MPNASQVYVHTVVPPGGAITGAGDATAEVLGPSFFANAAKSAFPVGDFINSGGGSSLNCHTALSQLPAIMPVPDPLEFLPITNYHSGNHELGQVWIAERRPLSLLLEPAPDHLLEPPGDGGGSSPVQADQPERLDYGENLNSEGKGISDWGIESELAHRLQVLNYVGKQLQSQRDNQSQSTHTLFNPDRPADPSPNTEVQVTQQDSLPNLPEEPTKTSTQVLLPDSSSVGLEFLSWQEGTGAEITDEPKVHPSQVEFHKHPVVRSKAVLLKQNAVTEPRGPKMSHSQVNIIPPAAPGDGGVLLPPQGQFSTPGEQNSSHRRPTAPPERVQAMQEPHWSTPFARPLRVLDSPVPNIDAILSKNTRVHGAISGTPSTTEASFCGGGWRDVKLPTISPESFPGLSERPRTSEGEKSAYHGYIGGQPQNFGPGPEGTAVTMVGQQATSAQAQVSPTASEKKLSVIEKRLANQRAGTRRSTRFRRISRRYDD